MSPPEPIRSFVERYRREYDFYYELARLVSQRCDGIVAENGIRCMVTFRAKSPRRLEEKLLQRHPEKQYQNEDDIRADIVDLSGVRIALYFPGDREKIGALLRESFIVLKEVPFPDRGKGRSGLRFDGYHATHYRVQLDAAVLSESQKRYAETMVEVQVASVLMHAWSEVEHDLIYKPLSGQVSTEERAILDGLNGLVISGEVFLERLQAAFEARVSRKDSTFTNQYELAAFLYEFLRSSPVSAAGVEPVMGRVDLLFQLLQSAGLNRADALQPYLENLDTETERRPLAEQVIDRIVETNTDLLNRYVELRRAAGASASTRAPTFGGAFPSPELVGSFLQKWIIVERFDRALGPAARRFGFEPRSRRSALPEHLRPQFGTLRRLRNNLVHGMSIPEESLLESGGEKIPH